MKNTRAPSLSVSHVLLLALAAVFSIFCFTWFSPTARVQRMSKQLAGRLQKQGPESMVALGLAANVLSDHLKTQIVLELDPTWITHKIYDRQEVVQLFTTIRSAAEKITLTNLRWSAETEANQGIRVMVSGTAHIEYLGRNWDSSIQGALTWARDPDNRKWKIGAVLLRLSSPPPS